MSRIGRVLQMMEQENLDAILVADRYNVRYISCFTGDTAYLYISQKRRILMTDSRYTTWARSEVRDFEIIQTDRTNSYQDQLSRLLEEEQISCIGFENRKMLYSDVVQFQKRAENIHWQELEGRLDALRQIKDQTEREYIAQAERIGDQAFAQVIKEVSAGMTELELAWELETNMRRAGAQGLSFETIAVFGERTAMPHAVPGGRRLTAGDLIVMDFGCIYEGYCSDMTRTVVLGKADRQQQKIYETVLEAQLKALSTIRAGLKASDVDAAARQVIEEAGYGDYFGHGLGHSVGLAIHESPALAPKDHHMLQEYMLETIEPGIYIPDFGGVRIEDLVIIRENGCDNLTHSPKELLEL